QTARPPAVLPAAGRARHPPDPEPPLRPGLHHRRGAKQADRRRGAHRRYAEPADCPAGARRARGADEGAAALSAAFPQTAYHGNCARRIPSRLRLFNKNNRVGAWRSLVAHVHGVQGVPSSNLGAPTSLSGSKTAGSLMSGHICPEAPQGCRLAILSLLETLV